MKWVNHATVAGAVTALWRPELVPLAVAGSTAPDWLEGALRMLGQEVKHRGPTHYLAHWAGALGFGLWLWDGQGAVTAFAAGGLSHVLCDALTVQGVPLGGWSDRRFHLFGGRLKTGQAGEYWVAGGVAALCLAIALLGRAAEGGFSPYFVDYAGLYRRGMIDAKEWRENRFRWF